MNLNSKLSTIGKFEVKDLFVEEGCRCSLSSTFKIVGKIKINDKWFETRWNDKGNNITGNVMWKLVQI